MARAVGIDLSAWQTTTPNLRDQDFVIPRACYGDARDGYYDQHAGKARELGKVLGAYCFGRRQSVADQVRTFLSARPVPDFYVLDWENDVGHPDMTMDQVREFIDRVQQAKGECGLYANRSGWFRAGQDFTWIAAPGQSPALDPSTGKEIPWLFRQHQSAVLGGNTFDGTPDELKEWAGMKPLRIELDELHRIALPAGATLYDLGGKPSHPITAARKELSNLKVRVGADPALYWVISAKEDGKPTVLMARANAVTDEGKVQTGGTDPAAIAAARTEGFTEAKDKAIAAVEGI